MHAIRVFRLLSCSLGLLLTFASLSLVFAQQPQASSTTWKWKENPRWERMPFSCRIKLAEQQSGKRGVITFSYEITSEDAKATSATIYNPFLDPRKETQTCSLLVFDEHKKFIGMGRQPTADSRDELSFHDWIDLPHGARVQHSVELVTLADPRLPQALTLRPGKYYLQLAFWKNTSFNRAPESRQSPIWAEFVATFQGDDWKKDYIRSNPVAFELTE